MSNKIEHNNSILGFDSLTDFATTLVGWKAKYFVGATSILGSLITGYVYDSETAVYFLCFLLATDTLTAIVRAIKQNVFTSKRLPRILAILVSYILMLVCSTWMAKFSVIYAWLPGAIYTGFCAVLFVSIAENLMLSGWIPKELYFMLKEKFDLKKLFKKTTPQDEEGQQTGQTENNGEQGNN